MVNDLFFCWPRHDLRETCNGDFERFLLKCVEMVKLEFGPDTSFYLPTCFFRNSDSKSKSKSTSASSSKATSSSSQPTSSKPVVQRKTEEQQTTTTNTDKPVAQSAVTQQPVAGGKAGGKGKGTKQPVAGKEPKKGPREISLGADWVCRKQHLVFGTRSVCFCGEPKDKGTLAGLLDPESLQELVSRQTDLVVNDDSVWAEKRLDKEIVGLELKLQREKTEQSRLARLAEKRKKRDALQAQLMEYQEKSARLLVEVGDSASTDLAGGEKKNKKAKKVKNRSVSRSSSRSSRSRSL